MNRFVCVDDNGIRNLLKKTVTNLIKLTLVERQCAIDATVDKLTIIIKLKKSHYLLMVKLLEALKVGKANISTGEVQLLKLPMDFPDKIQKFDNEDLSISEGIRLLKEINRGNARLLMAIIGFSHQCRKLIFKNNSGGVYGKSGQLQGFSGSLKINTRA